MLMAVDFLLALKSHFDDFVNPSNNGIRSDILGYHTSGCNDSTIADSHATHDDAIGTYPNIITDKGRFQFCSAREDNGSIYIIKTMVATEDMHIIRHHRIFTYAHLGIDCTSRTNIRILSSIQVLADAASWTSNKGLVHEL